MFFLLAGTFHMWEQLQGVPIIPLIFFGSFDIYPVGSWINTPGKVVVRYLKPVLPTEATSRDEMMRLVRRRMLQSLADCPPQIGASISWMERVQSVILIALAVVANMSMWRCLCFVGFEVMEWSTRQLLGWTVAGVMAITAVLYVYYVYIVTMGGDGASKADKLKQR